VKRPVIVGGLLAPVSGCGGVLEPHGPIGAAEKLVLIDSLAIMLVIVVPVIVATFGFAWWFRASNSRATYRPDWAFSGTLELIVWAIPALVITFLGGIAWFGSHALDPYQPLPSRTKPLEVEVVSLDWKWLFIYPEQNVASINQLTVPVGVPLHLKITSASVFNVFFVPQLGSEIYSMYGMTTQMYLQADRPGVYLGISGHFSGDGFPGMNFDVRAVPDGEFRGWVAGVHGKGPVLDDEAYRGLLKQSQDVIPYTFRAVKSDLFEDILSGRLPAGEGPSAARAAAGSPAVVAQR
jgi:cytochrome o ubiquinol oxidase subunit 2